MIRWSEPTKWGAHSIDPPGYTMVLVPFGDVCHIEAWYKAADGSPHFIGDHRHIPRFKKAAKKQAADDLYAACERHHEAIKSSEDR